VYLPVVLVSFALMMLPIVAAERRGRMRTLLLAAIALLAVVQLGLGFWRPSLAWIVFWLLLFFVAFNVLEASLPSMVSRLAPASNKGLALGIYGTSQSIGLFAGGALGGWLAHRGGASDVFEVAALAMLAWLAVAWGMKELPRRAPGTPIDIGNAPARKATSV
jgi:predicted MFS family arabinose efflux permease